MGGPKPTPPSVAEQLTNAIWSAERALKSAQDEEKAAKQRVKKAEEALKEAKALWQEHEEAQAKKAGSRGKWGASNNALKRK